MSACLCVCVCGVHQLVAAALIIDPREGERGGLSHNQDGGIRGGKPPPVGGVWAGEIEDDQRRGKTILLVGEMKEKTCVFSFNIIEALLQFAIHCYGNHFP